MMQQLQDVLTEDSENALATAWDPPPDSTHPPGSSAPTLQSRRALVHSHP
jgi:hypothetical protein